MTKPDYIIKLFALLLLRPYLCLCMYMCVQESVCMFAFMNVFSCLYACIFVIGHVCVCAVMYAYVRACKKTGEPKLCTNNLLDSK